MFGGPEWNLQGNLGSALDLELAVYTNLWQDEIVDQWISTFQSLIPETLALITPLLQSEWYTAR
jgi:hypothetical protein